jgi:hypothetical protein
MKAYEVRDTTGPDGLVLNTSRADPQPAPGQVLVRMRAAALNYRDQGVIKGAYGYTKFPVIPLSDGAGEVVAVGDGVVQFKPGDRVTSTFFVNWTGGRRLPQFARRHGRRCVGGLRAAPGDRRNQDTRQYEFRGSRDAALRGAHRVERRHCNRTDQGRRDHCAARHRRGVLLCTRLCEDAWRLQLSHLEQ